MGRLRYRDALRQQIETASKKRLFRDMMSEHEKKVNGMDLAAYENMDTSLHAKVIGVRDSPAIQTKSTPNKISRKVLSPEEPKPAPREDAIDYELARKINIADCYQRRNQAPPRQYAAPQPSPSKLLESAIRNMNDPTAEYMRNDTYNRAYGYKPVTQQQPRKAAVNQSFDCGERPQEEKRGLALNRSVIMDRNPLAAAGQAQIVVGAVTADKAKDERGPRAAGTAKRQAANYNIITCK